MTPEQIFSTLWIMFMVLFPFLVIGLALFMGKRAENRTDRKIADDRWDRLCDKLREMRSDIRSIQASVESLDRREKKRGD